MKIRRVAQIAAVALLCQLAAACANQNTNAKAANGHWVTLPPVTGSYISRRVWVDDAGNVNNPSGDGNVQTGSAATVERMQKTSGSMRPPGR